MNPLGLPGSTQVPQSRVSPGLDPAGHSSRCFCPLQNLLCPVPSSCRTPFSSSGHLHGVTFLTPSFCRRTTSPPPCSMPLISSFSWHLLQWLYSRSWAIAHPCRWRPQNSRQILRVFYWCRTSVISPSFSEAGPASPRRSGSQPKVGNWSEGGGRAAARLFYLSPEIRDNVYYICYLFILIFFTY